MAKTTYDYHIVINSYHARTCQHHYMYNPQVKKVEKSEDGKTNSVHYETAEYQVEIKMVRDAAEIHVTNKPTFHPYGDILNGKETIISSSMRKLKLIHLFLYGRIMSFKSLTLSCCTSATRKERYNQSFSYSDETQHEPIYSMIGDKKLLRPFSEHWKDDAFIQNFLSTVLLTAEPRWAAVSAYACGKSKEFEAERLLYNWMSFNAMYGFLCAEVARISNHRNPLKPFKAQADAACLNFLYLRDREYDMNRYEGIWNRDTRKKYADEIGAKLITRDTDVEAFVKELRNPSSQLCGTIQAIMHPSKMDAYHFMLLQFPYQLRCGLFHGGKSMPILSYADSSLLKSLSIANRLLEDYIDNHLQAYFDLEYIEETLIPEIEKNYTAIPSGFFQTPSSKKKQKSSEQTS